MILKDKNYVRGNQLFSLKDIYQALRLKFFFYLAFTLTRKTFYTLN